MPGFFQQTGQAIGGIVDQKRDKKRRQRAFEFLDQEAEKMTDNPEYTKSDFMASAIRQGVYDVPEVKAYYKDVIGEREKLKPAKEVADLQKTMSDQTIPAQPQVVSGMGKFVTDPTTGKVIGTEQDITARAVPEFTKPPASAIEQQSEFVKMSPEAQALGAGIGKRIDVATKAEQEAAQWAKDQEIAKQIQSVATELPDGSYQEDLKQKITESGIMVDSDSAKQALMVASEGLPSRADERKALMDDYKEKLLALRYAQFEETRKQHKQALDIVEGNIMLNFNKEIAKKQATLDSAIAIEKKARSGETNPDTEAPYTEVDKENAILAKTQAEDALKAEVNAKNVVVGILHKGEKYDFTGTTPKPTGAIGKPKTPAPAPKPAVQAGPQPGDNPKKYRIISSQ